MSAVEKLNLVRDFWKTAEAGAVKIDDVPELHEVGLLKIEGRKISLPERFRPDEGALAYHREKVFLG